MLDGEFLFHFQILNLSINIILMRRRNSKKSDSFDIIKISSKKSNPYVYSLYLNSFYEAQSNNSHIPPSSIQRHEKYFLELPKIQSYFSGHSKDKINETESHLEKSRLLILGFQQKKDSEAKTSTDGKKEKEETGEVKRKLTTTRDNFMSRRAFLNSILFSFGIAQIQNEKKKIFVYVEEGNNSRMIKQIFRKRVPIVFTNDKKEANIIWTRFCDYETSKLTSKFKEESVSEYPQGPDYIIEKDVKNNTLINKEIVAQNGKRKIILLDLKFHNHLRYHYQISDKKSLFKNLRFYCKINKLSLFDIVPKTFEIRKEIQPLPEQISDNSFWVVKPGEDTNRGEGITIAMGQAHVRKAVDELIKARKTALIQEYIEPLLYKNRKFDIRCYVLVVSYRNHMKAYWYKEGYLRTCSKQFNWDPKDIYAHLTNDAIQKKSPMYGKYEQGNKLSFSDLKLFLKSKQMNLKQIVQNMKTMAYHSIKSSEQKLRCDKNQFGFEIFGYDFLIDKKGKPWLIQINTNPCLEFSGSLTSRIIWHMVDNSFKISVDPLVFSQGKDEYNRIFDDNKFQCLI